MTIASRIKKESREIKEKIFLQQYFLQNYLYSGKKEVLEKAGELIDLNKWNDWHCAILLESDVAFFDTAEENLDQVLQQELRRKIFYLNLNGRQSLVLFQDVYCDYQLVANHIYNFMKREYMERFYLAVSRKFEGYENLPSVLEQLEQQMEEKFYHPDKHIFTNEDDPLNMAVGEVQDSQIMQAISEDITRKEVAAVRMIYDEQTLDAAICIVLDYDKIFQPLMNILNEENGGMVTDEDGTILYNKSSLENIELERTDDRDTALEKISQECAYTMAESEENNWNFYLYKSQRAISGSVRRLLLEEIPLMALCCLITLALGLAFSRIFTRKIEELTRNMDQVNHGSREVTVSSDSEDEVGILINSFRRMMDEINRLIDEVYVNKIALKEYELKALQAQINPHFLYNTLSMMNWMAIRSGQMEISKVTLALSTFYRTALSKGEDMVTVETCIRNMEAYLEIQLTMHDHNFTVEWETDPDIKNEKMPKLLLQPVVENAIEHGIDEKEEGDKKLFLSFKGQGDDVEIIVRDNGTGMEQEKAETLVTYQAKGYGLKNVNDRIRLLYGESYGIQIYSAPGEGTTVIMRFPKEIRNYEE